MTDPTGAVIPRASIHLSAPGVDQHEETDGVGRFSFAVPPGVYTLEISSPGFATFVSTEVRVEVGGHLRLPIHLAVAGGQEQLEVREERDNSADPNSNGTATEFTGSQLNMLSDDPATLAQQINALAGPGLGGAGPQILVNGFSNGRLPPKAAIRSIRINRNPFSAYYDSIGFGRVEIETRPGADKLHGAVDFAGTDQPFDARNPYDLGVLPPFYQFQTDANLNGPINRKTSFFLAENTQQLANNAVVNADVLDPALAPTTLSEAVPAPQLTQTYSLRVDRQFSPGNFGFLRDEWSQTHSSNSGIAPLVLPEAAFTANTLTNTLQAADTQSLGLRAVNEVRFQYLRTRTRQDPNSTATGINVQGAFLGGGSFAQRLRDNADRYELQDRLQFDRGKHAVQTGFRFRELREATASSGNFNGQYTFNDIAAYRITAAGLAAGQTPAAIRAAGGGAAQFNLTAGEPSSLLYSDDIAIFGEDDWRLRPDLTFSYGLRLESQSAIPDHFDPAPRLGLAWVVHRGKQPIPFVVLRGGYGIFYDRFPAADLLQAIRQNGRSETEYFVNNPDFYPAVPPPSALTASQPTVYRVSPHLRAVYNQIGSFGADRPLGHRGVASAMLLYAHASHEYLTRNLNAPLPGTYNPADPNSGTRPLGTTANLYQFSSDGNENDEVFLFHTSLEVTPKLQVFGIYTLQKQRDEVDSSTSFPSDEYNLRADYGRAGTVFAQSYQLFATWSLPRGFESSFSLSGHTGLPFNITTGTDLNGDTIFNDRPAFATDLTRASAVRTPLGNFDTQPMAGQTIVPRNYGNSPGLLWTDLLVNRTYHVGPLPKAPSPAAGSAAPAGSAAAAQAKPDRPWELKFQVEFENLLNHNNPGLPVGVLPTPGEPLCSSLQAGTGCSYFGRSLNEASDFSPLTASNRTILLQTFLTF